MLNVLIKMWHYSFYITEYVDTKVKAGETYYYRVKAINYKSADYDSDYSPVAQVTIIQGDIKVSKVR